MTLDDLMQRYRAVRCPRSLRMHPDDVAEFRRLLGHEHPVLVDYSFATGTLFFNNVPITPDPTAPLGAPVFA
jgi:hypothetical protein